MSDYRVASRYAKSLIELAEEKSIVEDVLAEIVAPYTVTLREAKP